MSSRQQAQVACQRCRQRRAKCSGEQPCLRCEQRGETCEYKKREWLSKGDLRAEIGRLRQGIDKSTSSRGQDQRNGSGADESALLSWIKEVKSPEDGPSGSLSAGDAKTFSGDSALGGAGASPSLTSTSASSSSCFEQLLSWRSCHPTFDQRNQEWSGSTTRAGRELTLPSAPLDAYGMSTDMDPWTQVGWTRAHIRHLFDVLVTWDSTSLCILSKKQFLQDYETGSLRFCSSALVHAVLAVSTRLMNEVRDDAHILPTGWLGSHYFLQKANATLKEQGSVDSLPDIQSLGMLAFYHIRCGQEKEARQLAESCSARIQSLCVRESVLDAPDAEYAKSQEDTFVLDQLPYNGAGINSISLDLSYDTALTLQLANPQILFVKMFQLTEWVYKAIVAHQKDSLSNQGKVLATYTKCLGWYRDVFELVGDGGSRSPFVLFIHMYYQFCLLCAFRPFIGCNFTDTESQPHEICGQAVQSILALAQSYDDLFTLRRVSALIPYFVCASGLFSLAMEDSGSKMDFIHLRPQGAVNSEVAPPLLPNMAEPASETTSPSRVRVSTVVQARLLLSKMGESHPAAALAAAKLRESSQSWRSKEVNFT
ncbi:Fungal transcriptional regulatory protein [Beauveria brongniartii RCEF 3172]|uniref:Fungal transcriptional regulatory protein n=1 Tax=Beauveria brongniartii RCEF 3172 TaxID=1081107 RepID=A0A167HNR6_9HYPO|nr:Fungal transcriptional regulatory protein [Beauveria brongniartii RCEF 3172]